jgi:ATP-dependent Lon protease
MTHTTNAKYYYKRVNNRKQKSKVGNEIQNSNVDSWGNYYTYFRQQQQQPYYDPLWNYNCQYNGYYNDSHYGQSQEYNTNHSNDECANPFGQGSNILTSTSIDQGNQECAKPSLKQFVSLSTPGTIKDFIDLINENKVCDDIEYNIDLKSLNNIKNELIELENMVGTENIKKCVFEQLIYFIQDLHIRDISKEFGNNIGDFKHTVIMGPPGTGKTKIAKIIGKMYSKLGILKNNVFRKVTRNDLIAGYLGQTAIKTKKVIEECIGGVLFIDEAYSLSSEDQDDIYSKECLDTLCEALSDYKDDLMVIVAGYEGELNKCFFSKNSGLESRFIWRFKMDSYNASELMQIFVDMVYQQGWEFENYCNVKEQWFKEKKDKFSGMGRDMEALVTYTKIAHGIRIYGKQKDLRKKLSLEDMENGYKSLLIHISKKEQPNFLHSIYI